MHAMRTALLASVVSLAALLLVVGCPAPKPKAGTSQPGSASGSAAKGTAAGSGAAAGTAAGSSAPASGGDTSGGGAAFVGAVGIPGTPCDKGSECYSGICEGKGCSGKAGRCVAKHRVCPRDEVTFCGCDGKTFKAAGSCPGKLFKKIGACK